MVQPTVSLQTAAVSFPALSKSQKKRDASGAIRGYLYQFERSVIELLEADEGAEIRIEGIEDIDLFSNGQLSAVQVKYLSSKKYSLAEIAKPIFLMLESFASGNRISYVLHAHFADGNRAPEILTVEQLETSLAYSSVDQERLDAVKGSIPQFANHLKIRDAVEISDQRKSLVKSIAKAMRCDEVEAEILHLPRAVHLVNRIATERDESKRILRRKTFLERLEVNEFFYAKWHSERIEFDRFADLLARKIREAGFKERRRKRSIVIHVTAGEVESVGDIVEMLAQEMTGKALTSSQPWTVILVADCQVRKAIKEIVLERGIAFNDGYEEIAFTLDRFCDDPVVNTQGKSQIISKSSYQLRLIGVESVRENISLIEREIINKQISFVEISDEVEIQEGRNQIRVPGLDVEKISKLMRKVFS